MNVTGDGDVTLTGSVTGTLTSVDPDLVLTVENGVLSAPQIGPGASNLQMRARLAGGAIAVERLTARWGSATVEASGTVPMAALPPITGRAPATKWSGNRDGRGA